MMFKPLTTEFYSARYYKKIPTLENAEKGVLFRYEKLTEKSKRYSQPINNLIAKEERYTILTSAPIDFVVGGYVLDQDGKMFVISDLTSGEVAIEQRALFFKPVDNHTVLSLTKVANPLGLKV
jgi:hypothetical protein